ncbi:hypothetical protein PUNSTDRAFT_128944 [Punctularia strigosozonata HHB-11173 SS5]|uniref:uncharacterized protein n=1 Tax=Punctularia strigosozonata (strain HHB-11173) TaxID=741275 RepID=UPI0004418416|nr:uncharacterized protein PUNSTDRAFT_128944 [Punctularia strigosozonata HHB-11173 SS5]EIN13257.1 hypothetical protein PUNSTDRAFT_128944 [Punctularia strigosozonata HHB-11173 SS5]
MSQEDICMSEPGSQATPPPSSIGSPAPYESDLDLPGTFPTMQRIAAPFLTPEVPEIVATQPAIESSGSDPMPTTDTTGSTTDETTPRAGSMHMSLPSESAPAVESSAMDTSTDLTMGEVLSHIASATQKLIPFVDHTLNRMHSGIMQYRRFHHWNQRRNYDDGNE